MKDKKNKEASSRFAFGLIFGFMLGVMFNNVALGLCGGVMLGCLLSEITK